MFKKYTFTIFVFSLFYSGAFSQTTAWFNVNESYKTAMELFEKEKYAAASAQFKRVEENRLVPVKADELKQISLLKENARYYEAVCAVELDNADAEQMFLNFIREYPASAYAKSAYFQMGRSYFNQNNYAKAVEWFEKIDAGSLTAKENTEYRFKLAYAYFFAKEYKKAKPIFQKLKDEKNKYTEDAIYYYAYLSYLDEDYKTALRDFERLKGSTTYRSSYPYYISALYFLDKRYDEVLSYTIPAIVSIDEQYKAEMYRIIAASYFAKTDYNKAAEYYEKFQAKDNNKTQNNQDDYQIGYTFYKLNNYSRAVSELEKMEDPDQFYQNGMITLGESHIKTNNKQSARNAFFKASKLDFDKRLQEEGLFQYAKLSYELEFHGVALDAVQEFIKNYPNSPLINQAKTLLGQVLLSTKNYKEAVDILESIKNKTPESNTVYQRVTYYRGLEFYNERAFENGISMFMRSQSVGVDENMDALATYWLAEAMYEVRKYKESVAQFERFLASSAAKKTEVYNYANYAIGYSAYRAEAYTKSANYFDRFLKGNEKDQNTINDAILRLADSYFVLKSYEKAMFQYNKIIASGAQGRDYALFQRGVILGLQGDNDAKISTHESLLQQYPNSSYADDAGFEIAYAYFVKGNFERSKSDLTTLIEKYPRSSYVPRALVTIGLVDYNQGQDDVALATFQRVVKDYSTTDEAKQALESIKNIYVDRSDANGYIAYANTTGVANLSTYEQDNIMFQAANNLYLKRDFQGTYDAVNAYFDKFPKAVHDKNAKFIRAESLVRLNRPDEAVPDYEAILNDWTSDFTQRSLISISNLYLKQKKYNEAIVYLKRLETTSEYKSDYGFAVNNLLEAYSNLNMPDEALRYADYIKNFEKSSAEEKLRANLYSGKAYLSKGDTTTAVKSFTDVASKTQTITGAEAKYMMAFLQYMKKDYKTSQKTAYEIINKMPSYDYWVAKSYLLLADNFIALKDEFQAKPTLQSIIDNYVGNDDIVPTAKEKLEKLNNKNKANEGK